MTKPVRATTVEYTGNKTFKASNNRSCFFITMSSGEGALRFGNEGGEIPLAEGDHYNPPTAFATSITVTTEGTFVVHTDEHATPQSSPNYEFQSGSNYIFQDGTNYDFN